MLTPSIAPIATLPEADPKNHNRHGATNDLVAAVKNYNAGIVSIVAKHQTKGQAIALVDTRYGTNHRISEFDLYYQDVQKRIKDQQWPNSDYPAAQKIDITIVVDMLLTGFDSKYLNTLYVDKNLKHHGLIQAFSRTNRVLNATKPYGNILDFRQQQDAVDAAIALFSGEKTSQQAREIWLVEKAPVVIQKLEAAVQKLDAFMKSQRSINGVRPIIVDYQASRRARLRYDLTE